MPAPMAKRKRDNEEWRIQSDFFRWWRWTAKDLGVWHGLMFHIPNGSLLGDDKISRAIRAKMLKLAGVVNGVVDCFLAVPIHFKNGDEQSPDGYYGGLWIEFKKPSQRDLKNGGLSDAQQEFIGYLTARGYSCHVCYTWQEARDVTLNYLGK